jgi:WD repeat-containing protein mio
LIGGVNDHPTLEEFANAVAGINRHFNRAMFNGVETAYPEHRQLCLAICGWAEPPEHFETELSRLESQGLYTKAAGWALFNGLTQRAIKALSKGDPNMKLMSVAVAGYYRQQRSTGGDHSQVWKDLTQELGTQLQDPYSRAIFAFVSNGNWNEVINEVSLPLRDRIGVALRFLPDPELSTYLDSMTNEVIQHGDIEGIVLTGITEKAIDLFQTYIGKYNDHQTAVLVTSFAAPLYFNDFRFIDWRETYRYDHNTWKLHLQRCRFDVDSVKLSKTRDDRRTLPMPPRQVSLRCNYCQQSVARTDAAAAAAAEAAVVAAEGGGLMPDDPISGTISTPSAVAIAEQLLAAIPGGPANSTSSTTHPPNHHSIFNNNVVCPSCGRTLPRCAVCMMWLGQPKPNASSSSSRAPPRGILLPPSSSPLEPIKNNSNGSGGDAAGRGEGSDDPMEHFFNFCLRCNHGFHANHARDWFARHRMCPVPECQCTCAMHAG